MAFFKKFIEKTVDVVEDIVDSTPVVGHVKGAVHYIAGDKEHGNKCMSNATRSTAVIGAGVLTGGAGAPVVLGGLAGMGTGMMYDTGASLATRESKGYIEDIEGLVDNTSTRSVLGLAGRVAGDFFGGYEAAASWEGPATTGGCSRQ